MVFKHSITDLCLYKGLTQNINVDSLRINVHKVN